MTTVFRLAEHLQRLGLSQSELARRSGVTVRTINRICNQHTAQVHLDTLDRLAGALGIDPSDLIGREKKSRR